MRNDTFAVNALPLITPYNTLNAYVANDVRVLNHRNELFILTGENPAADFDLVLTFSKFLVEYSATQPYYPTWAANDTITFSAEILPVKTSGGEGAIALSEPIEPFKYRQLLPGLTKDASTTLTAQSRDVLLFDSLYTFYPNGENVTIDVATAGYAYGFANAAELFDYYGNTTEVLYSCDNGVTWVAFDIANNKITGQCSFVNMDVVFSPRVRLVVPAGKLVKPFQIPITIDGILTAMEWVPTLDTIPMQPLTKHSNTGIEVNITSTYQTYASARGDGFSVRVDVDPNVLFTTPVVYQLGLSHWAVMLKDSLDCKAYNGNTALTMTPHSFANSEYLFKDKSVAVRAKAGDKITMICSTPINPNPKKDNAVILFDVHAMGQKAQRVTFLRGDWTKPNEDWLVVDDSYTYMEGISGEFLFSPAPKTVDEAKKRIIKLLQTAKPLADNKRQQLDVLKNKIATNHIIITSFEYTNHRDTKTSSFTAQNGLGKVFEFNKKMPAT